MIIRPVKHGLEELVGVSPAGRTQGLHLSDIYGRYYEGKGKKRTRADDVAFEPLKPLYYEAGLTFEQMLEDKFKERMVPIARPGELVTPEGIIFSPDLFIFGEDVDMRLGEIKLTWMSSREVPREECTGTGCFPEKFAKYFTQIAAYCYNVETPYARLIAFFINGNYRPQRPELLAWDVTFTARELRDNWDLLIRVAKAEGML